MGTSDYLLIVAGVLLAGLLLMQLVRRSRSRRTGRGRDSYIEALRHLVDGNEDLAYTRLVETVRVDTSNIDAYILLGDILRRRGNLERALKVHRDVTIRTDLSPSAHRMVLKSLALDYMAARRLGAAERALQELDRLTRGDRWARLRLLDVYEAQGDWVSAFELGKEIQDAPSVDGNRLGRYRVEQARDLLSRQEYHKARLLLKEALKFDEGCAEAYLMIGDSYYAEDRTEDAVTWWEEMVEQVPARAGEVFKRLEESLYELGDFGRMTDIYTSYLESNPSNPDAVLAMSNLLERKGETRSAIDLLQRKRSQVPDPAALDHALVLLYHQAGQKEKALSLAVKLLRRGSPKERPPLSGDGVPTPAPSWLDTGGTWDPYLGEEDTSV
ncbi:MAG: tetratricopeptide repeat protein [bacterium]